MSAMHTVSRHYLRRRARARARELNADYLATREGSGTFSQPYRVEKAVRGPYRWRVVR